MKREWACRPLDQSGSHRLPRPRQKRMKMNRSDLKSAMQCSQVRSSSFSLHDSKSVCFAAIVLLVHISHAASSRSIKELSEHFSKPANDFGQWIFAPQDNLKECSTDEHPGLVTIYEAGKGKDIKGLLKDPIKIGDYPLPWEFQTS